MNKSQTQNDTKIQNGIWLIFLVSELSKAASPFLSLLLKDSSDISVLFCGNNVAQNYTDWGRTSHLPGQWGPTCLGKISSSTHSWFALPQPFSVSLPNPIGFNGHQGAASSFLWKSCGEKIAVEWQNWPPQLRVFEVTTDSVVPGVPPSAAFISATDNMPLEAMGRYSISTEESKVQMGKCLLGARLSLLHNPWQDYSRQFISHIHIPAIYPRLI